MPVYIVGVQVVCAIYKSRNKHCCQNELAGELRGKNRVDISVLKKIDVNRAGIPAGNGSRCPKNGRRNNGHPKFKGAVPNGRECPNFCVGRTLPKWRVLVQRFPGCGNRGLSLKDGIIIVPGASIILCGWDTVCIKGYS